LRLWIGLVVTLNFLSPGTLYSTPAEQTMPSVPTYLPSLLMLGVCLAAVLSVLSMIWHVSFILEPFSLLEQGWEYFFNPPIPDLLPGFLYFPESLYQLLTSLMFYCWDFCWGPPHWEAYWAKGIPIRPSSSLDGPTVYYLDCLLQKSASLFICIPFTFKTSLH
jgi:hypothetical protein